MVQSIEHRQRALARWPASLATAPAMGVIFIDQSVDISLWTIIIIIDHYSSSKTKLNHFINSPKFFQNICSIFFPHFWCDRDRGARSFLHFIILILLFFRSLLIEITAVWLSHMKIRSQTIESKWICLFFISHENTQTYARARTNSKMWCHI